MSGGLIQLVAYGAQDVYLTGEPKFTHFRSMYRQHTNFAMETVKQIVTGGNASNGQLINVTLGRHGDLIGHTFVQLKPAAGVFKTSNNTVADSCWIAERAFSSIELQINGQTIDKHYAVWWRLYSELCLENHQKIDYDKMTSSPASYAESSVVYLPLLFFFNREPGLFLPLIALQYAEVKIIFECSPTYSSYFEGQPVIWSNYIFLDKLERAKFSTGTHEYLIDQVQYNNGEAMDSGINESAQQVTRLQLNHPIKYITWMYRTGLTPTNRNAHWNFTSNTANVNVTCNPLIFGSGSTHILPERFGVPFVVQGPPSMFSTDGDFSNVAPPATPIQTIVTSGTLSSASIITGTGLANILPGDVVAIGTNAGPININGATTALVNTLFFVRSINTGTGAVTLSPTWSPNMASTPSVIIAGAGTAAIAVYRMTGATSVLANTTASAAQGSQVTLASTQGILPGSVLLFSTSTTNGPQVATAYYVSSVLNATTVAVSTTWPTVTPTNFTNSPVAFAATVEVDVFSYFNVPVTSSMVESGLQYPGVEVGPLHKFQLLFNGKLRFSEQYGKYFNQVQPYYHFKGLPYPGIYAYSFALNPCDTQPSGTCNFSRIDIPQAQTWLKTMNTSSRNLVFNMCAVNYNILKISSGLGGIMFAN